MYFRSARASWALIIAAAVALTACGRKDDASMLADSVARDLARAGVDSTAQPALKDVPPAEATPPAAAKPKPAATKPTTPPAKTEPAPAETKAPAAPRTGVVASGAMLSLAAVERLCTNTNKVGDMLHATLIDAVPGSDGSAIPAGARVTLEVTTLKRSENSSKNIEMGFRVVSIEFGGKRYTPEAEVVSAKIDRVRSQDRGDDAKKVVVGAAAGAIIGQIIGRDRKGTIIGAAAGAAAGGAAAAATADFDGCVNENSNIAVKLLAPLTVPVAG